MRIVSLCPSITELVFSLDRGDNLVGITDYCIHPSDRVSGVEKVGGTKSPAVRRIIELEPDIVLLNDEENRIEDAQALERAGIRCLSSMPRNAAETAAMVRSIGRALDRVDLAERIAGEIEAQGKSVAESAAGLSRVRFAYLIWRKPWMTINNDTFSHSLLSLAGGINVFGDRVERYPKVTDEELLDARPSILLLGSEPFPFNAQHVGELARVVGLDPARVLLVDGEYLSWYGSRTPDGIAYAASVIDQARSLVYG